MKQHLRTPPRPFHVTALFSLAVLLAIATGAPRAYAAMGDQSMDPAANNGTDQSNDDTSTKPVAPPSPTPGSKVQSAPAAEASTDVKSLGPNEALFDAISRGDLDAARDAIARGADLNAVNSLGQKPIDASIDLGRNDITFVLLAERPVSNAEPAPATVAAVSTAVSSGHGSQAAAELDPPREVAVNKPAPNPGTPEPAVGFLGF